MILGCPVLVQYRLPETDLTRILLFTSPQRLSTPILTQCAFNFMVLFHVLLHPAPNPKPQPLCISIYLCMLPSTPIRRTLYNAIIKASTSSRPPQIPRGLGLGVAASGILQFQIQKGLGFRVYGPTCEHLGLERLPRAYRQSHPKQYVQSGFHASLILPPFCGAKQHIQSGLRASFILPPFYGVP